MKLWQMLRRPRAEVSRYTVDDYARWLTESQYGLMPLFGTGQRQALERPEASFEAYTYAAYKSDGIVFACMNKRMSVFTEARFRWQHFDPTTGRDEELFIDDALQLLEQPWPNGSSGELLARMIQDVDLCGNFYAVNEGDRLRRLRPDWVEIVLSAIPEEATDVDVLGYAYYPGGIGQGEPELFTVDQVAHWSPIPDPIAQYRGMSWLTPVIREIQADKAATKHKLQFFSNAATPNLAVSFKESVTPQQFKDFMAQMNAAHQGVDNAYKTMYLGGGADVTVVGADMRQLDFKATQGAGETRIAAAGGVHPVLVGLSEGLQGSSLNAGNYAAARRGFADGTMRPLWRSAFAALSTILTVPENARLWFDQDAVPFLREDAKDAVEIQQVKSTTIRQYIDAGFEWESVVKAVDNDDLSLLKHSGLYSVQLQEPGAQDEPEAEPAGDAERAFNPTQRRDAKGRWTAGGGGVAAALESGADDALEGFGRETLRREAKRRGIDLRRGASIDEIRDALHDHHEGQSAPRAPADRVREAYDQIAKQPGDWVSLTDLRKRLDGMSRQEQDQTLMEMALSFGATFVPEDNQKTLTDEDRAAAIYLGGEHKHLIGIEGGQRP